MIKNICSICEGVADSKKMYKCRKCYNQYMRSYRIKNLERIKAIRRESRNAIYASNAYQRLKDKARASVWSAIMSGKLKKKPCEKCGQDAQAHHDSYLKKDWLNVRWLCIEHHAEFHRNNKYI